MVNITVSGKTMPLWSLALFVFAACSGPSGGSTPGQDSEGSEGDSSVSTDDPTVEDPGEGTDGTGENGEIVSDSVVSSTGLRINELLAKDAAGGSDWAELYNLGDAILDISAYKLVDDLAKLPEQHFVFPNGTTIAPHGFLVVDCDGAQPGEGFHAPFKLKPVEGLYLIKPAGEIEDQVEFSGVDIGLSYSRIPDGTGDFKIVGTPTRGESNHE